MGLCALLMHDVLQHVLDRTEVVEGGVPPWRVVKVIDVVRDLRVGQVGCQIRAIERQVAFGGAEERLRYGIVPTVTPSALNSGVNCRLFLFVRSTSRRVIAPSEVSTKAGGLHRLCPGICWT